MAKVSVSDLLRENNVEAKPGKKKSDVPEMKGFENLSDSVVKAYEKKAQAEAEFRVAEAEILREAQVLYESRATRNEFSKSLDFIGKEGPGVQITWQDKFSSIPISDEPALRKAFGSKFDEMFEEKRELRLVDTSDKAIKILVDLLGAPAFKKLFEISVTYQAKPNMDVAQFKVSEKARGMLRQTKPALKVRKG